MSLHDTRRSNFVLSELLIWTKYLQYALQRMYELANEIDEVLAFVISRSCCNNKLQIN